MKNKCLLLVCLGILILSGCISHIDHIETNPLGKKYQGTVTLRNMVLPLPEGEWEIVGRGYSKNGNYVQLCLERDKGNKPESIIVITRDSLANNYTGYTPHKVLNRRNMLYVVSNSNTKIKGIDGWYINHFRQGLGKFKNKPDAIQQAYQHIIDNKLIVPGNFIKTGHILTGKSRKNKYLRYDIFNNPEVEGLAPPQSSDWGSSDWHIARINADPKKVAYIEIIKEREGNLHQKLKEAFEK